MPEDLTRTRVTASIATPVKDRPAPTPGARRQRDLVIASLVSCPRAAGDHAARTKKRS